MNGKKRRIKKERMVSPFGSFSFCIFSFIHINMWRWIMRNPVLFGGLGDLFAHRRLGAVSLFEDMEVSLSSLSFDSIWCIGASWPSITKKRDWWDRTVHRYVRSLPLWDLKEIGLNDYVDYRVNRNIREWRSSSSVVFRPSGISEVLVARDATHTKTNTSTS